MKKALFITTALLLLAPVAVFAAISNFGLDGNGSNIETFLAAEKAKNGIYEGSTFNQIDSDRDRVWQANSGSIQVRMVGNLAGFGHLLTASGPSGVFSGSLWSEAKDQFYKWETFNVGTGEFTFDLTVRYNLKDKSGADNWIDIHQWSSLDRNYGRGTLDHMVAFRKDKSDTYVLGWEDLPAYPDHYYPLLPDMDYNDLIIELRGASPIFQTTSDLKASHTPIPGAVWLFATGLVGLIGIKKKKGTGLAS